MSIVDYNDFVEHLSGLPLRPEQTADAKRVLAGTERALARYLNRSFSLPTALNTDGTYTEQVQTDYVGYAYLSAFVAPNTTVTLSNWMDWTTPAMVFNSTLGMSYAMSGFGGFVGSSYGGAGDLSGYAGASSLMSPRITGDGIFSGYTSAMIQVTYTPVPLPDDDLDDVRLAIMDVAARSVAEMHSDARGKGVPGIGEPLRNHFLEKPLNWQPDELVWFARLKRRTLA